VAVTIDPHGDDVLAEATQLLRQHTDAGWTAISADILQRAFAAFRPSEPVRGRHEHGDFFVASTVIVAQLRHVIDDIPHAAATKITCATDDRQHLAEVTIQIIAAYGTHLLTLAEHVHTATTRTLADLLGDLAPSAAAIHTHVHVGDITDDPRDVR
jgi:predicted RNA-binding Zn ribbon-like protein